MIRGRITKGIGGFYYVDTGDAIFECKARGKFRKLGLTPMVGDICDVLQTEQGRGYLQEILPRKNQLIRPAVSNLDLLVIVASSAPPVTDRFLIDRVSAIALHLGMEVALCINKCDLDEAQELYDLYQKIGIPVIRVSGETGCGLDELRKLLIGKCSAFTGNSGVGKSTVLNQLEPAFGLKTGEINEKIGRGRHTTRHVELLRLEKNTWIADTPGFSAFDTERMELVTPEALQHGFPEFKPYLGQCRYQDCAHVRDQGCAVLEALAHGEIAQSRHESYVRLYESMKELPSWERKGS